MDTLLTSCAGLDVHKDNVFACVRLTDERGRVRKREVRTFGTVTERLRELADWLAGHGITDVAMESTGVYWKPVFNLLEGRFKVCLVNAQHCRNVPGRKTDVKDCEWLADLLAHGLVKPSFIPPEPIRQMRELTRQRTQLTEQLAQASNRIQKVLEDANIKLGSEISDVLGMSGRAMLEALIAGRPDPASAAGPRMKAKLPALRAALEGRVNEHHRFLLGMLLDQVAGLEALIKRMDQRIEEVSAPFAWAVLLLMTIPGIARRTAENIVAEIGPDMTVFATAAHLAKWVGVCPRADESNQKKRSTRILRGNSWLKPVLVQAAWAASRSKDTHFSAFYHRLARHRGKKKALIALANKMVRTIHAMLANRIAYRELGPEHSDQRDQQHRTKALIRQLERLGHKVTLQPTAA